MKKNFFKYYILCRIVFLIWIPDENKAQKFWCTHSRTGNIQLVMCEYFTPQPYSSSIGIGIGSGIDMGISIGSSMGMGMGMGIGIGISISIGKAV